MVPGASGCPARSLPAFVAGRDGRRRGPFPWPGGVAPLPDHSASTRRGRPGNKSNGSPQTSPKKKNTGRVSPDPLLLLLGLLVSVWWRGQAPSVKPEARGAHLQAT